jgi:hypothetical protein
VQSLNDLIRETRLSRAVLAEMLRELINERLVRPVGHEIYEIQHDRLAAAVIESNRSPRFYWLNICRTKAFSYVVSTLTPSIIRLRTFQR